MTWDPEFVHRSPMLAPLAQSGSALRACADWPSRSMLQSRVTAAGITNARGVTLRLIAPSANSGRYESAIYERGEMQTREGQWHDLFNVLAWLAYPRTKAALNARHVEAMHDTQDDGRAAVAGNRGRVQDALTVFDESGAIFATSDEALAEDLCGFRWKDLFWEKRRRVLDEVRVFVFGHALFEKALAPYVGLTAHALPVLVAADFTARSAERQLQMVDELAAAVVTDRQRLRTPQELAPLPLLGVPGWWADNERESFYDNTDYFRPTRHRR